MEEPSEDDRAPGPSSSEEAPSSDDFVRVGVLFYGALAIAAVFWRMGFYGESIWLADDAFSAISPARDVFIGAGFGFAVVLVSRAITLRTEWGDRLGRELGELIGSMSVPNAVLLAFASGLAEEMFFRGAMQPRFGLLLTSLLFAALHFAPGRGLLPWTGFALVVGIALGLLFEWTGSLLTPVVAHVVINGVNLPYLIRRYGGGRQSQPE